MKPGPEDFEELFNLYVRAETEPGISFKESIARRRQFTERLQQIWNQVQPASFPMTYYEFRRLMIDQIVERLRKDDVRFRRSRF